MIFFNSRVWGAKDPTLGGKRPMYWWKWMLLLLCIFGHWGYLLCFALLRTWQAAKAFRYALRVQR